MTAMFLLRFPLSLFTLTWQSAFLALGQIWANKVRAMLTTIGIVIGVASVTAVIAALTGLKENVLNEFESFGTNKIFITPRLVPRAGRPPVDRTSRSGRGELEGLLDHCPSRQDASRRLAFNRQDRHATAPSPRPTWSSWASTRRGTRSRTAR